MIALVSFPRSGNTFFRNLLYELYGIESSTFHREPGRSLDENWANFPVVKTHLLPDQLPPELQAVKVVYIIRDGRDALVSLAHHRKDIIEPGTDYYNNLLETILAEEGSYFGGWSRNVAAWSARAAIVIRYEDLIHNPIEETEKLRAIMDLPPLREERLPSFKDLKFGQPQYGAGLGAQYDPSIQSKNFRKGKSGSWQEEMPKDLHRLFWLLHGEQMEAHQYVDGKPEVSSFLQPKQVLLEVSKLYTKGNDGIKQYLDDLVAGLQMFVRHFPNWEIDMYHQGQIASILDNTIIQQFIEEHEQEQYESWLLKIKADIKEALPERLYNSLSYYYRKGPFRRLLAWYRARVQQRQFKELNDAMQQRLAAYDLIHLPLPQHYHLLAKVDVPKLVTVHDITHQLFPQFHTAHNVQQSEAGIRQSIHDNAFYISISEATKRDFEEAYAIPADRIRTIYEGVSGRFSRKHQHAEFAAVRAKYGLPESGVFLMSLSTIEPRKNILRMIEAFRQMKREQPEIDAHFFVCGNKGWLSEDIFASEDEFKADSIYFSGFIDQEDLPLFYAHANALCYVSHYEGFGLPLLEAMQSGTPVIYGNNSSMPEVVGEGGIGVSPEDVNEIRRAMHILLTNKKFHKELTDKAWRQANTFSLNKSAFHTLLYYEDIIAKTQG
jgi:glycosyltransferase involved in cell wall biosynthesis